MNNVVIDTSWSGNYYHFMVDLIGKVGVLSKFFDPRDCVFLFNTWQKLHREAFSFLGLKTHWIGYDKIYHGDFVYPSLAGASGAIPRESILFLRSLFYPKITSKGLGDFIYLSRGGAKRKILNETAVISELQKVAPFICINAEDYTFGEQISIFKSAKIVVGSHGAGLVNSVFMQEGTVMVELLGPNYQAPMFKNLANQANLVYKSIGHNSDLMSLGQTVESWDSDYEFNIDGLLQSVHEVFQKIKGI
jgi:capsular polysaccharide biosynthesis protein